jgi:hypothetical protein
MKPTNRLFLSEVIVVTVILNYQVPKDLRKWSWMSITVQANTLGNDGTMILKRSIMNNCYGSQLSNTFIILMALSDVKESLNTTQISDLIAFHTKGQIYKISATLKDALEHRLKREGYVDGIDIKNKSLYSITPKGRKLLKGWIAFLSAYS